MALAVILGLIVAVTCLGDWGAKSDTQVRKLEDKVKQLQKQNQQLKIEGIKKNETRKVEAAVQVQKVSTKRVVSVSTSVPPDKEGIATEIRRVFGTEYAVKVAVCESGLNPNAVGSHGERGIFQIHPVHVQSLAANGFTWDDMFNYQKNIAYARLLYGWNGWQPWSCSRMI